MHKYFIVYEYQIQGSHMVSRSNGEVILDHPIEGIEDIQSIQKELKSSIANAKLASCVIIFWKSF